MLCLPSLFSVAHSDSSGSQIEVGYRIGWAIATPRSRILALDRQIDELKELPSDPPPRAELDRLARISATYRRSQLAAFQDAIAQLSALGAPVGTYQGAIDAVKVLSQPLDTETTGKVSKEGDPAILKLLAMLDESDHYIPKEWNRLGIWLKLSNSPAALWGFRLGQLSATLDIARKVAPSIVSFELVDELRKDAPSDEPQAISDAIDMLSRAMKRHEVNADIEGKVVDPIMKAYQSPTY